MTVFKQCPACGFQWMTRDAFLGDPNISLVGYQVNFKKLTAGLILFNHTCKATMALAALVFTDLYDGPVFVERATGGDNCPGHCLHESDFEACPSACECAFVRHVLQRIKGWPKQVTRT